MPKKIDEDVLAELSQAEVSDSAPERCLLRLVGQMPRDRYVRTNKVLEALGGKWIKNLKGHEFPIYGESLRRLLDEVILTGSYDPPASLGFFPTPAPLADEIVALADIKPGMKVLEPSAGDGALIKAIRRAVEDTCRITAVEVDRRLASSLTEAYTHRLNVVSGDFLNVVPSREYDRVVMNPPFERQQDIDHVLHALKFLKPGGRLVSIMAAGVTFRGDRKAKAFREVLKQRSILPNGGLYVSNQPDVFKPSGTTVSTVTVVME